MWVYFADPSLPLGMSCALHLERETVGRTLAQDEAPLSNE